MKIKSSIALFSVLFFFYNANALANSCTEGNIAFYLKNGFTHKQIVQLCTQNSQPTPPVTTSSLPQNPPSSYKGKDQDYFDTVLESNSTSLDGKKLSFNRRECAIYGDLDMTHMRDKVCINTRTHITLKGLEILRATKGVPLLKKQELLVKGDLMREYLSETSHLNAYKIDAIKKQLPNRPTTLNIPVKTGIDPKIVAQRLKKLL